MPNQAPTPNQQNPAGKPAAQQPRKDQDMDKKSDSSPSDEKMKDGGSCGC